MEAISYMKLENKRSYLLGTDDEKKNTFFLLETEEGKNAAKVAKAGEYYYLNVGDAFETLGYKYQEFTIMFDITKDSYEGKDLFVFTQRRAIKRNVKQDESKEGKA
jgi:hypothetical protein